MSGASAWHPGPHHAGATLPILGQSAGGARVRRARRVFQRPAERALEGQAGMGRTQVQEADRLARVGLAEEGHQAIPSPRWVPFSRASAMATYSASRSIPIQGKPSISAAMAVVPEPRKGSSTVPPGGVTRRTR
jgi:hypothetical protein